MASESTGWPRTWYLFLASTNCAVRSGIHASVRKWKVLRHEKHLAGFVTEGMKDGRISIRITTCTEGRWCDEIESIQVGQSLPADVISLKLRWFCGKSGIVFFSAVAGDTGHRRSEVYALNLNTRSVEKLASHDGEGDLWEGLHGYEMDQVAYLASLAEPAGLEDM